MPDFRNSDDPNPKSNTTTVARQTDGAIPETDRPQTIDLPDRDSPASQKRGSDPYKLEPPEIETSAKDASRLCPAKRRKTHN